MHVLAKASQDTVNASLYMVHDTRTLYIHPHAEVVNEESNTGPDQVFVWQFIFMQDY